MIPWTKIKDISNFQGEYAQANVPNRVLNRLLDNDKSIEKQIDTISLIAEDIPYATEAQLLDFELSGSMISPGIIMALSATPTDIYNSLNERFVTVRGHEEIVNNLNNGISYIDVTHKGVLPKWPTEFELEAYAKEIIGNYTPVNDTIIDVQFLFEAKQEIISSDLNGISLFLYLFFHKNDKNKSILKVGRYRYKILAHTTTWEYIGRAVNTNGVLYE